MEKILCSGENHKGEKIKNQRFLKHISQEKLAELVDVTSSYISNIESGNRIASLHTML